MKNTAIRAARAAGELLLAGSTGEIEVDRRERRDIKLAMDRKAEAVIIDVIRRRYPDHGILSEECGRVGGDSEYLWVIDPLDGTFNYSRRLPLWCTSVGLLKDGEEIAGAILDPTRQELFHVEKGGGAFLNDQRLEVSDVARLEDAVVMIALGLREGFEEVLLDAGTRLALAAGKGRSLGSAALDLAYVACGRVDAYFEFGVKIWDVAAGIPLIREAGGEVTVRWHDDIQLDIAVSNGRIHDEVLAAIGW